MWKKKLNFIANLTASHGSPEEPYERERLSDSLSELSNSHQQLQKSEALFRFAFDYTPFGSAIASASGQLLHANQALCSLLGYNSAELTEISLETLIYENDVPIYQEKIAKLNAGSGQVSQLEIRIRHKQGNYLWTNWIVGRGSLDAENDDYLVFQLQTISHRKRTEKRFSLSAMHDPLTGLPNRVLLMERLQAAFNRSKLFPENKFAVLFLGVTKVDLTNNGLENDFSDKLQYEIAQRLESQLRSSDTIAKLGENEFAVLLENVSDIDEALQIGERFQTRFAQPFVFNEIEIFTNLSAGIAMWTPEYDTPGSLLRDANAAFAQAKRSGRGRCEIFDSETHKRTVYLQLLENDLRQALERNEFCLYYQPIVDLKTCRLQGLEALIRWQHPKLGQISPMEFIPIAEEAGFISSIGFWVLRAACQQLGVWKSQHPGSKIWMSVNVSSKQLMDQDVVVEIRNILEETGISPRQLKLEITESAMINNIDFAIDVLNQLKQLGVLISVDDFGTGYSSLSNIHRLPVDMLKIDRSFLMNTSENTENWEIIKSILTLAESLKLEVVAEGVETGEQVVRLQNLGCVLGQGYYFARPLENHAVDRLFNDLGQQNSQQEKEKQPKSEARNVDDLMLEYFDNVSI